MLLAALNGMQSRSSIAKIDDEIATYRKLPAKEFSGTFKRAVEELLRKRAALLNTLKEESDLLVFRNERNKTAHRVL